jgi:histidinol phosphatase-like enzyme
MSDWKDELNRQISDACRENTALGYYLVVVEKGGVGTSLFAGIIPPRHLFQHAEQVLHEDMEDKTV